VSIVNAVGGLGTDGNRILSTGVSSLVPALLIEANLKLYVLPAFNPYTIKEVLKYPES